MSNEIAGKVIAVLDNREVLLGVGEAQSVRLGMRFVILGSMTIETVDNQSVNIEYAKTIVKIVRLQEGGMSIGRTFRTIPGRKATLSFMSDEPARTETIDTGDLRPALAGKDMVVRPGDVARLTVGDEYLDAD